MRMVDRVALAIEKATTEIPDWHGMARAAIMVLREPTEAMCAAGQQVNDLSEQTGLFEFLSRDEMTEAWQAMIDEALR